MALTGVNSQPKIQTDAAPVRPEGARVEAPRTEVARGEPAPVKTVAEKAEKAAADLEKALTALTDFITTLGGEKHLGCSSDRAAPQAAKGLDTLSFDSLSADSGAGASFEMPNLDAILGLDGTSSFQAPVAPPSQGNANFLDARGGGAANAKSGGGGKIDPGGYGE